jgi:hypothetical protein
MQFQILQTNASCKSLLAELSARSRGIFGPDDIAERNQMSWIDRIAQIDKKFAWGFLGVLVALFGLWYYRENPAALRIELLSRARVYDIHADVPKLSIFFEGENIKEKKQILSFFTVRFTNPGGKPITQNLYDTSLPFGVQIMNGRAFPPELVDASQKYLADNLKPVLVEGNQIRFEKIVFDAGATFTIRFLVLHGEGLEPFVKPIGKIAGVGFDDLPVIEVPAAGEQRSFWGALVAGSPWVHIVRFLCYILIFVMVGLVIAVPNIAFNNFRSRRRKKKTVAGFCSYRGKQGSSHAALLAEIAIETGEVGLVFASRLDGLKISEMPKRVQRLLGRSGSADLPLHYYPGDVLPMIMSIVGRLRAANVLSEDGGEIRACLQTICN